MSKETTLERVSIQYAAKGYKNLTLELSDGNTYAFKQMPEAFADLIDRVMCDELNRLRAEKPLTAVQRADALISLAKELRESPLYPKPLAVSEPFPEPEMVIDRVNIPCRVIKGVVMAATGGGEFCKATTKGDSVVYLGDTYTITHWRVYLPKRAGVNVQTPIIFTNSEELAWAPILLPGRNIPRVADEVVCYRLT